MGVKDVTVECKGRGKVDAQPEGESKRVELTEGGEVGKGGGGK